MREKSFFTIKAVRALFFFVTALICTTAGYWGTEFARFPTAFKLMEGQANGTYSQLPVQAVFEAENEAVLRLNNRPLSENAAINLNRRNIIKPQESGSATMTLKAFGLPLKKVTLDILPDLEVIPCGMAVGVRVDTMGVMVLGTGIVEVGNGQTVNPSAEILQSGDLILRANEEDVKTKEQFEQIVRESEAAISLEIKREDEIITAWVTPVENQIGAWVRDGTQGIGTITYYNPHTNRFAALGHGIVDVDTKQMMRIKSGEIKESEIDSVVKGKRGTPGELIGELRRGGIIGRVEQNSVYGVFGTVDIHARNKLPREKMPIALQDAVRPGPAIIRANVERDVVTEFDIYIEAVNRTAGSDDTRGMVIRITDPALLARTNGIVQGMSGSPIIQNGRLIGAVTHVFVHDPSKGYGIFIENMLKYELSL